MISLINFSSSLKEQVNHNQNPYHYELYFSSYFAKFKYINQDIKCISIYSFSITQGSALNHEDSNASDSSDEKSENICTRYLLYVRINASKPRMHAMKPYIA